MSTVDTYVGSSGELTVDKDTLRVHDGSTAGGHVLVTNTTAQTIDGNKKFATAPVVPTQVAGDNSDKAASTEYVDSALAGFDPSSIPVATDTDLGIVQVGYGLHVKNGVVGLGEVEKPVITAPNNGDTVAATGFTVDGSAFNVLFMDDSHASTKYRLSQSGAVALEVTSNTDLTSHTFTESDMSSLPVGTTYDLQIQYEGTECGESAWSDPVSVIRPNV